MAEAGDSTDGGGPSATPVSRRLGTLPGVVTPPLLYPPKLPAPLPPLGVAAPPSLAAACISPDSSMAVTPHWSRTTSSGEGSGAGGDRLWKGMQPELELLLLPPLWRPPPPPPLSPRPLLLLHPLLLTRPLLHLAQEQLIFVAGSEKSHWPAISAGVNVPSGVSPSFCAGGCWPGHWTMSCQTRSHISRDQPRPRPPELKYPGASKVWIEAVKGELCEGRLVPSLPSGVLSFVSPPFIAPGETVLVFTTVPPRLAIK